MERRELTGPLLWAFHALTWAGIGVTIFHIFRFRIGDRVLVDLAFWALLLLIYLPTTFIIYPARKRAPLNKVPWYDFCLAGLSALGPAFVFVFAEPMYTTLWPINPPLPILLLGLITWALVLEGVRRTTGWVLTVIIGLFSIYPLFASRMPSPFFAKSYSIERLTGFHFLGTESIFGAAMQAFGSLLIGFMVFGLALQATGAAEFLVNLAQRLVGRVRGAPALVAVVASASVASLSGSAVANVISTGTTTIPAMKKMGYKPHMAAAIESVASTGGILTPPVMGSVAFIMAALLEIPYAQVAIAASIPMLIYYVCVGAQVFFHAQRNKMPIPSASEIPPFLETLKGGWFYVTSVVALVYMLFVVSVEGWAPYYATVFLIACSFIRKETRPNLAKVSKFSSDLGRSLVEIAPALAGFGLLMGSFSLTGIGESFGGELVILAGGNLYLLLIVGAIAAYMVGSAVTQIAVYIFMYVVFVPVLLQMGVPVMAANLFFLYWAMVSLITPPTCVPVLVASNIAGADMMRTAWQAMRLGIVAYLIPFAFVLNPALVTHGSLAAILQATVAAVIGVVILAAGVEGYVPRIGSITTIGRILMGCSGILMLYPAWMVQAGGAAVAVAVVLFYSSRGRTRKRKEVQLAHSEPGSF